MSGSSHLDVQYNKFPAFCQNGFLQSGKTPRSAKLIPAQMQINYFLFCAFVTGRRGKGG